MMKCAVRRGFFVLRDCDEPAMNSCAECGRPICAAHTAMSDTLVCVECSSRRQEEDENEHDDSQDEQDWYDESAAYAYRHEYYSGQRYNPVYSGTRHDSYYDDYDVRSFDEQESDTFGDEEEEGAGFLDS